MPEQSGDSFDFCVLFRVYFIGKGAVSRYGFSVPDSLTVIIVEPPFQFRTHVQAEQNAASEMPLAPHKLMTVRTFQPAVIHLLGGKDKADDRGLKAGITFRTFVQGIFSLLKQCRKDG